MSAAEAIEQFADDAATGELLDTLAMWNPPADGIPFPAALYSWPAFTKEQMNDAWACFQEAVRIREGLATRDLPWFEQHQELSELGPGEELQDAALAMASAVVDEARNHFLNGGPR